MRKGKQFLGIMAAAAVLSLGAVPVAAEQTVTDMPQMTIVTDKEEYSAGDTIKETIHIENTTGKDIENITVEGNIPEGYTIDGAASGDTTWKMTIERLEAGETIEKNAPELEEAKPGQTEPGQQEPGKEPEQTEPGQQEPEKEPEQTEPEQKNPEQSEPGQQQPAKDPEQNSGNQNVSAVQTNSLKTEKNEQAKSAGTGDPVQAVLWFCLIAAGVVISAVAVKAKKAKRLLSFALAVMLAGGACSGLATTVNAAENDMSVGTALKTQEVTKNVKADGKDVTLTAKMSYADDTKPEQQPENYLEKEGYKEVWKDDFNGDSLNRDDWNVELHEPGWVNSEWQEYVDSDANIQVKDGNLLLKPVETVNADGTKSYTSGRVNTQNKHDFKYGYFECRAKVPTGKGYLPAFWMMPTDENLYGQWPKCGEIDMMEVMGQETNKLYGTIHYGEPHDQSQGTYVVAEEDNFADNYHTYACEWLPGKIIWYVDGVKYHEESDWFSAKEGQGGEVTYPAPFDQPFYMILNLAVGGSWVGYPDENTTYEDQAFAIDYVKVYQKDSYDENVEKPVKEVSLRDPDATGNYINNGDFATAEDLDDDSDWKFLTELSGEGTAEIKNNEMVICTTDAGTADYSIQLVQAGLPMQKGGKYKVTFDAYADEARTMITDISAPDHNYTRYLPDTTVELTTEKQTYTYEFQMTGSDDANGRLEFNLGNTASTATVHLSNVRVEKTGYEEIKEDTTKKVLADGNCVYNGSFEQGKGRLGSWEITNQADADIVVTSLADGRRLQVTSAPETKEGEVLVGQSDLALNGGTNYVLSFTAQADEPKTMTVTAAGQTFQADITTEKETFTYSFTTEEQMTDKNLFFDLGLGTTVYLDQVRIEEDSLIKNGSFNAGLAGFEAYCYNPSDVTYVVDSLNEDNAADFTINDTGDQDWHIQLKQSGVKLEKDQWYRLSLKMKSSKDRKVSYALQRNGATHNDDWTPYCQEVVDLNGEYQTFISEFQMAYDTDTDTIFNVTMGAVDGVQIKEQHRICIDDITLEKIDAPVETGSNLIQNGDFAENNADHWETSLLHDNSLTVEDQKAVFTIKDLGTEEHSCQFIQKNLRVESGASYTVKFTADSSVARKIKFALMIPDVWDWYTGADVQLEEGEHTYSYDVTIPEEKETTDQMGFYLTMGYLEESIGEHTISISDVSIVKN